MAAKRKDANDAAFKQEVRDSLAGISKALYECRDRVSALEMSPSRRVDEAPKHETFAGIDRGPAIGNACRAMGAAERARAAIQRAEQAKYAAPTSPNPIQSATIKRLELFNSAAKGEIGIWNDNAADDPIMLVLSMQVQNARNIDRIEELVRAMLEIEAERA